MPIKKIGSSRAPTGPGAISKPSPSRPAAMAIGPATMQGDGSFLLIENHCPICAAAKTCQGFCRSELELFRAAFGTEALVMRQEHLLSNGRRCVYRVTSREGTES